MTSLRFIELLLYRLYSHVNDPFKHHLVNGRRATSKFKIGDTWRLCTLYVYVDLGSLTWSCGSRQRDTTSSGWKFHLNTCWRGKHFNRMNAPHGTVWKKLMKKHVEVEIAITIIIYSHLKMNKNEKKHRLNCMIVHLLLFGDRNMNLAVIQTIACIKGFIQALRRHDCIRVRRLYSLPSWQNLYQLA